MNEDGDSKLSYIKSINGIFKICSVIFSLSAFISMMCFTASWANSLLAFFDISCLFVFIYAFSILIISIFVAIYDFEVWPKVDLIANVILSIMVFSSNIFFTSIFTNTYDSVKAAIVIQYFNGFVLLANVIFSIL